jgi:hypothetical protein
VDPPLAGSQVLVLLGEAGMGKTVLLVHAERQAQSAGLRVLSAAGIAHHAHYANLCSESRMLAQFG